MASLQAFAYAAATRYSGQHIVPSTGQVLPAVTRWEAAFQLTWAPGRPTPAPVTAPSIFTPAGGAAQLRENHF